MISHNKHLENLNVSQESQQSQKTWNLHDTIQQLERPYSKNKESNDPTLQSSEKVRIWAKIHSNLINLGNHRVQVNN